MKLNLINSEITKLENELLCVPIYEEGESKEIEIINAELDGLISELNDNRIIYRKTKNNGPNAARNFGEKLISKTSKYVNIVGKIEIK